MRSWTYGRCPSKCHRLHVHSATSSFLIRKYIVHAQLYSVEAGSSCARRSVIYSAWVQYSWNCLAYTHSVWDISSPGCNYIYISCMCMLVTFIIMVSPYIHVHTHTCSPVVLHFVSCLPVCCVCMTACGLFPRLPWWGRETGGGKGGRGWRGIREEDTSVCESTKSTVHVRVPCMTYAYMYMYVSRACLRYPRI